MTEPSIASSLIGKLEKARNNECNCAGELGRCLIHEHYDHCIEIIQQHFSDPVLVERMADAIYKKLCYSEIVYKLDATNAAKAAIEIMIMGDERTVNSSTEQAQSSIAPEVVTLELECASSSPANFTPIYGDSLTGLPFQEPNFASKANPCEISITQRFLKLCSILEELIDDNSIAPVEGYAEEIEALFSSPVPVSGQDRAEPLKSVPKNDTPNGESMGYEKNDRAAVRSSEQAVECRKMFEKYYFALDAYIPKQEENSNDIYNEIWETWELWQTAWNARSMWESGTPESRR